MVVGLIVEPPLETVEGSSGGVTRADGVDFVINDLSFRVAPNDKTPYERATAQFKKDQQDTGREAGDQSLTGWWTRGEFSFHHGAGINYYEVAQGDSILNRYDDADGVFPFKPGKVTCQPGWSEFQAGEFTSLSFVGNVGSYFVVLDGTTMKYGTGPLTDYAPSAATVRAVATSPTLIYCLLSNGKVASVNPATGTETILYTGLTTTGRGIWYVKSRLLISDSDGKWYQLAPGPTAPPVAVAATDVVFTATDWLAQSTVSDSPGPILIGNDNRLFALTLDSTGSIPTLSAAIQVGELPPGEIVSGVACHLGFVVLVTGAGCRVGIVSDSGQVTYGPLLIEASEADQTPPVTSIGRYSTIVSVVVEGRAYEIDLSESIGNTLEFAYTGRGTPLSPGIGAAGMSTFGYSTKVAWQADKVYFSTSLLEEGYLTTGLHRFNTLEPKRFDSVRIVASGDGGTITVYRVDADGTETSLYVMDVSQDKVLEIPLRMTAAAESVGLKFVLAPDGDDASVGPTLLGYQIRALPEPKRQRLIRVPLLLNDVERRQPSRAVGSLGSAWSRLSQLESLESTQSIVTFSDLRTGETGRAYIESTEFTNVTPPSANSKGFGGGVLFLTLRKLP